MSKKNKYKSELQTLKEERIYKLQDFELPNNLKQEKRFVRITHYMLQHENYKKMSSSAKVVLLYMLDWAFASEDYVKTQTFDFSTTMLTRNGIMANKTAISALRELEHYGFIQKENNACKNSGITQKWSFSSSWYTETKRTF